MKWLPVRVRLGFRLTNALRNVDHAYSVRLKLKYNGRDWQPWKDLVISPHSAVGTLMMRKGAVKETQASAQAAQSSALTGENWRQ